MKKKKNFLDSIKVRPLTPLEIEKIKKNLKSWDEEYDNMNKPGDYKISDFCRGSKIKDRFCVFCKENLEHVFSNQQTSAFDTVYGSKEQHWSLLCVRCSKCGLKYELVGL